MCLACPMRVMASDGFSARCEARGVERQVGLLMLQCDTISVGDWVLVHLGQAIQRMTEADAAASWRLLDELLQADRPRASA